MENTITLDVADNGRIEIKTKLKEIPVEVAQRLLDEAIAVIVQTQIPIAFTQLIVTGILMIIFKVGR